MRVFLVGAALMVMFVSAMLFLVGERKTSGRVAAPGRFQVTGHVTGDFAGTPWAGTVAKLGTEQALIPPDGRFNFVVSPGRYPVGVCCSPDFQAIEDTVEVIDRNVEITLVARPLIEVTGEVSGDLSSRQGFTISARLQGTNVVDRAVTAADGRFLLRLREGTWAIDVDELPAGYAKPEVRYEGGKAGENFVVVAPLPRTISLQILLRRISG